MPRSGTTLSMEFGCGARYEMPLVLKSDSLLLANAALGDQMILILEAQHQLDHPGCPG